ncbi:MAG: ATP-dependent DNA helicase RecG [Candidatus Marinimicrobia bacterium]|nr:ATP-dependent DNA helicase RecG [Candidatus Neomarinimicrobiota bacterium]
MQPDTPISSLRSVGSRKTDALAEIGIHTMADLLEHFPRRYLDRSTVTFTTDLRKDMNATVVGKVTGTQMRRGRKRSWFEMVVADERGFLKCRWFNGAKWIQKRFNKGDVVAVSGKVDFYGGFQMVHPDFDVLSEEGTNPINTGMIVPLYPSGQNLQSAGLDSRGFRRLLRPLMDGIESKLPEYFPRNMLEKNALIGIGEAMRKIHFPDDMEALKQARQRLKFNEFFFMQLLLAIRRHSQAEVVKPNRFTTHGEYLASQYAKLPFTLTEAQKRVMNEIWTDLKSNHPMNRLLQGDVGSGKTVISLLAAAIAAGNGYQSAIMAPTEILAEQHYKNAIKFFEGTPIRVVLMTGSQTVAQKRDLRKALKEGYYHVAVGTHALIQGKVHFKNLQLVVIDEQHRFGVLQRGELLEKAGEADVLVMTATPIPRTLSMTIYGDLSISILDELPEGRQKIITRKVDIHALPKVYDFIKDELKAGRQAFVVYPLIEESEKIDLEAATMGYEKLNVLFKDYKVALLHGRMSGDEKDGIMESFSRNEIQVLVSTTVIEVGIDIPNATVMLIENAERFGLAQLHQLRGRIGRGEHRGVCVLLQRNINADSMDRLNIMVETTDGFKIAEEDLRLRGAGDIFGTRQSGLPALKIANILYDGDILKLARKEAFAMVQDDPHLRKKAHTGIRQIIMEKYADLSTIAGIG